MFSHTTLTMLSCPQKPYCRRFLDIGSPTLTTSSCQDNSTHDTSLLVVPLLGATYCQSRSLMDCRTVFPLSTFPCLSFILELPLSLFSFPFTP